jgi:3-oxoacyl-[acyl-carrier-protein] synthase-1
MNALKGISIVGLGARTALGAGVAPTLAAVRAGIPGFEAHPYMIDKAGERMIVAQASYLAMDSRGARRFVELAVPAAIEALQVLKASVPSRLPPIPVLLGIPAPRPGRPESLARDLAAALKGIADGPAPLAEPETFPLGHAAGLWMLTKAAAILQSQRSEFCLVGGVESYMDAETLEWVDANDQLHSESNSWGFVPGEAAGFCLLASPAAVTRYKLASLAQVHAWGTGREPNLIRTETVCLGKGLTEAFRSALAGLPPGQRVNHMVCDMNGEPYRADEFGFTVARTGGRFDDAADYSAPADCWGDVGAASVPLFAALVAVAAAKGCAAGPRTLIWASSEAGERGAALLEAEVRPCP